jgi:hypothetical protein
MITGILMDSIVELPCKRQKWFRAFYRFMVIYDIVIKPLDLLPFICDQRKGF